MSVSVKSKRSVSSKQNTDSNIRNSSKSSTDFLSSGTTLPKASRSSTRQNRKQQSQNAKNSEDGPDNHNLTELEEIFKETVADGSDGLDMGQFRVAMKRTMGDVSDDELDMLFMKVDSNCDGTVDWSEYLTYMLLEYQERENMNSRGQDCQFPNAMIPVHCNHLESICRITMLMAYTRIGTPEYDIEEASSRYLTLSKEGILNVWNSDWVLQKTTILDNSNGVKSTWYTDLVCLSNSNNIAVASTEYEISFYSMTSNLIQKKFQIRNLEDCVLSMDYNFKPIAPKKSILLWGDTSGAISLIRFYENPNICLFGANKSGWTTMSALCAGSFANVVAAKFPGIHLGWVQQVQYFVSKKGQESFVSGCISTERALHFADITPKVAGAVKDQHIAIRRSSFFSVLKGVQCLDYDPDWNLIVTGSRDCDVRMWNPYVANKSSAVLKGHTFAVVNVHIRGTENQIISISKDKNIRIWDLGDYSCKQNINGRNVMLGRLDVSALYVDDRRKEMAIATNQIGVFRPSKPSLMNLKRKHIRSHQKPVSCVLYNPLFKQLVTGSDDSIVAVWDLKTGTKTMQFCAEEDVEISAMALDPTGRRLATGSRNGSVALWNYNNGACLRRLNKADDLEIAGVIFCRRHILVAGWNKHVTTYTDQYEDDGFRHFKRTHGDDITSLVYHNSSSLLATSAYDGYIFAWSYDTEDVIVALNMYESILPIHLGTKEVSKSDVSGQDKYRKNSYEAKRPSKAWSSKSNTRSSFYSRTDSSNSKASTPKAAEENAEKSLVDRWLPSYLPWIKGAKGDSEFTDSDSPEEELVPESERSRRKEVAVGTTSRKKSKKSFHTDHVVHKLLFLQDRHSDENTAILLAASTCGLVAAWSVHQKGGLLGYFEATKHQNEAVIAMDSDEDNDVLLTGDSRGYLKMWEISNYCNGEEIRQRRERLVAEDVNVQHDRDDGCFTDGHFTYPTYIPVDEPPRLLWAIRAHVMPVTCVTYVKDANLVITGSTDCSVRLWNSNGRYISTFGQKEPWNIQLNTEDRDLQVRIPEDVRRVGSPTTLRTIKGGFHLQWKQVKNAVNFMGKARALNVLAECKKQIAHEEEIKEQFNDVNKSLLQENMPKRGSLALGRRGSVTVWMDDTPHSILAQHQQQSVIESYNAEQAYQRITKDGIKSEILGKINYKPKRRHKESVVDRNLKWSETHPLVYSALPYLELDPPVEAQMPEYLKKKGLAKHANTIIAHNRALEFLRPKTSHALPSSGGSLSERKSGFNRISPCLSTSSCNAKQSQHSSLSQGSSGRGVRDDPPPPLRVRWDVSGSSISIGRSRTGFKTPEH